MLLGLALVVALVWLAVRSCAAGPVPTAAGTPTATPASAAPASANATPTPSATATRGPWLGAGCSLQVEATTDRTSYPQGSNPRLGLKVTNTGPADCRLDAGTLYQEFTVRSGDDRVWSSADCQTGAAGNVITLAAGQSVAAQMPWSRVRSAAGCPTGLPAPGAGTYTLRVTLGTHTSEPVAFQLS